MTDKRLSPSIVAALKGIVALGLSYAVSASLFPLETAQMGKQILSSASPLLVSSAAIASGALFLYFLYPERKLIKKIERVLKSVDAKNPAKVVNNEKIRGGLRLKISLPAGYSSEDFKKKDLALKEYADIENVTWEAKDGYLQVKVTGKSATRFGLH